MTMHKVFVYGTLKRGKHNHHILHTAKFLGKYFSERRFTMYDGRGFPYIVPEGANVVVGELYEVDDATLERLDWLEGVKHDHYKRIETQVNVDGDMVWAYIYVATPDTGVYVKDHYQPISNREKYGQLVQEWN